MSQFSDESSEARALLEGSGVSLEDCSEIMTRTRVFNVSDDRAIVFVDNAPAAVVRRIDLEDRFSFAIYGDVIRSAALASEGLFDETVPSLVTVITLPKGDELALFKVLRRVLEYVEELGKVEMRVAINALVTAKARERG